TSGISRRWGDADVPRGSGGVGPLRRDLYVRGRLPGPLRASSSGQAPRAEEGRERATAGRGAEMSLRREARRIAPDRREGNDPDAGTFRAAIIETARAPAGDRLTGARFNVANGDRLQQTTGGLLAGRKIDDGIAFAAAALTGISG